jgi:hypothetical protein
LRHLANTHGDVHASPLVNLQLKGLNHSGLETFVLYRYRIVPWAEASDDVRACIGCARSMWNVAVYIGDDDVRTCDHSAAGVVNQTGYAASPNLRRGDGGDQQEAKQSKHRVS